MNSHHGDKVTPKDVVHCNHKYYQGEDDYGYQRCPKPKVKLWHHHFKQIDQDLSRIWERCFQKQTD